MAAEGQGTQPILRVSRSIGYILVSGVLVEPLGDHWAAFSPASGESHLINDTSAALLEALAGQSPSTLGQACEALAGDLGALPAEVDGLVREAFDTFLPAGLVRAVTLPAATTS